MWKKLKLAVLCVLLSACQSGLTASVNRKPTTMPPPPAKPSTVSIEGNCEQKSVDGYRDQIKISVKDNIVNALDWTANPRAGACRFELKNFTQVASQPQADLQSKKDKKCHIYVWKDERHVTVAMYGCKKICAQNDRILPVLLEPKTGACKPAGNDNLTNK
ncbi:MAG: hypothetical protein ACRCV6_00990 [Formosimonas sp.]